MRLAPARTRRGFHAVLAARRHGERLNPRAGRRLATAVVAACALVSMVLFLARPVADWSGWFDQGKYLLAARAWAAGNLDPAQHYYQPGYPLLAAPFVWLTPARPFLIPNLTSLLLALWLFSAIAARIGPGGRWARAIGAVVFVATTALVPPILDLWTVPWSSTPVVPLVYACLLFGLRVLDRGGARDALLCGLTAGLIAGFRPTDAMALLLTVPFILLLARRDARLAGGLAAGGLAAGGLAAGGLVAFAVVAAVHAALYGFAASEYQKVSNTIGFEWRLIPLRWVLLFVDPRPLYASGRGLAQGFVWIGWGLAGMAALLVTSRGRWPHALIIAPAALNILLYLGYRDLHAQGLWSFHNFHYFKWLYPLFGLYAVLLADRLIAGPRRLSAAGAALAAGVALFCWRAQWEAPAPGYLAGDAELTGPHALVLRDGFHSIRDGVLIAARDDFQTMYFGGYTLTAGGATIWNTMGLKGFDVPGGLVLVTLRPTPPGRAVITLDPALRVDPSVPPVIGRQAISFGLPCWFAGSRTACSADTFAARVRLTSR